VQRGAGLEIEDDQDRSTPLHFACHHGRLDAARLLLDEGANIEAKHASGFTPLISASQMGHLEVVRELIARGASVDARANNGDTPLMVASEMGHAAVARELLARGADVNARAHDNATALHAASYMGHAEALRELLRRPDAALNAQANDDNSPLMDACRMGRLMAATLLIAFGADLTLLNSAGESALHLAKQRVLDDTAPTAAGKAPPTAERREERKRVVALLLAHGAT